MRQRIDLTGRRFGFLSVLDYVFVPGSHGAVWRCQCDCGRVTQIVSSSLRDGRSRSCGCKNREATATRFRTHGKRRTREYESWAHAKQRCTNPRNKNWNDYGGRGIQMCERWLNSFENFWTDMGPAPKGCTLDRYPNHDGHYEPGNCRWATWDEQANNKGSNRYLALNNETHTVAEWARRIGITPMTLLSRLNYLSVVEALTMPRLVQRGGDRKKRKPKTS